MEKTSSLSLWIGLTRPKTLFSALSSVLIAIFYAIYFKGGDINILNAVLLILIGSLSQIASNIANDLIDYKKGSDTKDRKGPVRPLSKGLISVKEVKLALYIVLVLLLIVASITIVRTNLQLIWVGVFVLLGIFAYSGGPYPLSRHSLGEVAVLVFFGLVPTVTSFYVLTGVVWDSTIWHLAFAVGLSSCNILVVNNYRDYEEDQKTGKNTLIVKWGRDVAAKLYLTFGLLSMALLYPIFSFWGMMLLLPYVVIFSITQKKLQISEGEELNKVLADTARNTFILALMVGLMLIIARYFLL